MAINDRVTAFHFAVRNSHEKVIQLLIDRDADIEARNTAGFTALHCAKPRVSTRGCHSAASRSRRQRQSKKQ